MTIALWFMYIRSFNSQKTLWGKLLLLFHFLVKEVMEHAKCFLVSKWLNQDLKVVHLPTFLIHQIIDLGNFLALS